MHARVALYQLKAATSEEIVRKAEAEDGMLSIFRDSGGFVSYELIATDGTILSVSRWDSEQAADAATEAAASWVRDNLGDLVELQQNYVGEVVLSSQS